MSKKQSRVTNTLFNFTSSIVAQFISILVNFITRTFFIASFGKSYLGINGLFSNILQMLSLAEFGVGSAILFKLYEPIAREDHHRIAVLMNFYKRAYQLIGVVVTILGLSLIPFLPVLIGDYDRILSLRINVVLIYCLFLFKTVSSYLFFAYRSSIIKADQKEYIIHLIGYVFAVGGAVVQIICMVLFRNYILTVVVSVGQVIGENIACAVMADRMYPYLQEKTSDRLDKSEIMEVVKDCGALFLYKLNSVVLKATDNIIISMGVGLEAVGEYSNYYIIYLTLSSLLNKIYNSVAHSLGNLHTGHDREYEYGIFEAVMLITAILGGTAFAGVFTCADELVLSWIGAEWVLKPPFSLLMGLELYTLSFRAALSKYRTTMGLFQQAKYRPVAGMIINLVVSVALVNYWGICGVLVGTIVADWTTMMWFDPIIIHKYGFMDIVSVKRYYFKFMRNFVTVCMIAALDYFICSRFMTGYRWISVIIHALICAITVPGILIALNIRTDEGQYVFSIVKRYGNRLKKRFGKH